MVVGIDEIGTDPPRDTGDAKSIQGIPVDSTPPTAGQTLVYDGLSGAYVPFTLTGMLSYKGLWNAATNVPILGSGGVGGVAGDYYVVGTAGTTTIDGISDWAVSDWIINNGTSWQKVDNAEPRKTKTMWVSQALGSDILGDGSINQPYQNVQKACDVGFVVDTVLEVAIDNSVVGQNVIIPGGKTLSIFGPTADIGTAAHIIAKTNPGESAQLIANNTQVSIVNGLGSSMEVWLEQCALLVQTNVATSTLHLYDTMVNPPLAAWGIITGTGYDAATSVKIHYSQVDANDKRITNLPSPAAGDDADTPDARDGAISSHAGDADAHHDKSHVHDGVDGSGTVEHVDLVDKEWSKAGHTIDSDVDMGTNKVTNCPAVEGPVASDAGLEAGAGFDVYSKMGDAAGATAHEFRDSTGAVVAYIDSDGNLNLNGSISSIKEGLVVGSAFTKPGTDYIFDVVFATAYADANYVILISGEESRSWRFENQTAAGFRINTDSGVALGAGSKVAWLTKKI